MEDGRQAIRKASMNKKEEQNNIKRLYKYLKMPNGLN